MYRTPSEYDDRLLQNLWPRSGFSNDGNWFLGGLQPDIPNWFNAPETEESGAASTYTLSGFTKDSGGNAMSGVTVEIYTAVDDVIQGAATSLFDGSYIVPSLKNTAHYIRAYKAGGPFNYGGTSDNNLFPS